VRVEGLEHVSRPAVPRQEDLAGNGPHLSLIVLSAVAALVWGRFSRPRWLLLGVSAAILLGFLLFCLVLRWQPWHTRLQLPLFVLCSPLVAAMRFRRRSVLPAAAAVVLMAWASPFLINNTSRSLCGQFSIWQTPTP
jgi:hypothetical protein